MEKITHAAKTVYQNEPDKLGDLLAFVVFEENQGIYRVLGAISDNHAAFKRAADNMIEDIKKSNRQPEYRKIMAHVWQMYLSGDDELLAEGFDTEMLLAKNPHLQGTMEFSFLYALSKIPPETQVLVLQQIEKGAAVLLGNSTALVLRQTGERSLALIKSGAGTLVAVGLTVIPLAYDAYKNIKRWWNGEISGVRCTKNIIDSIATTGRGNVN